MKINPLVVLNSLVAAALITIIFVQGEELHEAKKHIAHDTKQIWCLQMATLVMNKDAEADDIMACPSNYKEDSK
jgi:hypothetical protein